MYIFAQVSDLFVDASGSSFKSHCVNLLLFIFIFSYFQETPGTEPVH